jgi:hypothetical protein
MRRRRFATAVVWMLAIGVVPSTIACGSFNGSEPTAVPVLEEEEGSERLALSVSHRAPVAGEHLPRVRIDPGVGAFRFVVARPAFCDTQARATIARIPGQLTIVAHVGPNPAALCSPTIDLVVEYEGVISPLAPGHYRVRVYEGVGDGRPRLIGSATVRVPST